jgi:hypothetical protein
MTYRTLAGSMLLIFMASACSGLGGRDRFEREAISPAQATEERARIIERLLPEETVFREWRVA